jgi:hypothetical protein
MMHFMGVLSVYGTSTLHTYDHLLLQSAFFEESTITNHRIFFRQLDTYLHVTYPGLDTNFIYSPSKVIIISS